jgi:hypothetical protein
LGKCEGRNTSPTGERVDRAQWPIYDAGFIIWGAAMLLAGFLLLRGVRARAAVEV